MAHPHGNVWTLLAYFFSAGAHFVNILPFVILIYTGWNSSDLIVTWQESPLEVFTWVAFLIWVLPIAFLYSKANEVYLALALITSFLGSLGSLHILEHFGLAFALASFVPYSIYSLGWLFCSICWMPIFTWLGAHYFLEGLYDVRFSLALFSLILMLALKRKKHE